MRKRKDWFWGGILVIVILFLSGCQAHYEDITLIQNGEELHIDSVDIDNNKITINTSEEGRVRTDENIAEVEPKEEVKCPEGYYESFEECKYGNWVSSNLKEGTYCCEEKSECPDGLKECEICGEGRIIGRGNILCCEVCSDE